MCGLIQCKDRPVSQIATKSVVVVTFVRIVIMTLV